MTRARAEAVVDMLLSNTMDFSDPGRQRERMIELVEAALAKAAPVSDAGALVERLRAAYELSRHNTGDYFTYGEGQPLLNEAADALLSAQEEAAGLRVELAKLKDTLVSGCPFDYPDVAIAEADPCPVCGGLGTLDAENKCPFPTGIDTRKVGDINTRRALDRAKAAESKLADAVGVLEPFAKECAEWDDDDHDDAHPKVLTPTAREGDKAKFTIGDLRRASAFLTSIKEAGDAR